MASAQVEGAANARVAALLGVAFDEHGSASHPWLKSESLICGPASGRNLADAVHFLCTLHGRHPGVIDLAAGRCADPAASAWLSEAASAFAAERIYLTKLVVAAGPVPGTPGGGASEAAVVAQRAAVATLAQSERRGCALGTAIALSADWAPIRHLLDTAARRLSVEARPCTLPSVDSALVAASADSAAVERALLFGAEQMLLQHRALWDLLEARHEARVLV